MSAPTVGDEIELEIEKGVYRGLGLARHQGQVALVARGLPGDLVRGRIVATSTGLLRVEPLMRLRDGPGRRASPCPVSAACGGCAYQDLSYPDQLALKVAVLQESLARAGARWDGKIEAVASPERGWRTRASLHCGWGPGGLRVGFHEEASHAIVEFDECLQLSGRANAAVKGLKRALGDTPRVGRRLEGLDLAESADGEELVAAVRGDFSAQDGPMLAAAVAVVPELTAFAFTAGRGPRAPFVLLRGAPFVHTPILGRRFRAHLQSFFQANRFLVEELARSVLAMVPPGGPVLDLYSGVGLFSIPLAARGDEVLGVEISESAVRDAGANARGVDSVRFRRAHVGAALGRTPPGRAERVVLDPPRAGAGREVVAAIAARRPEVVVYVSCDPPTLGRDLASFARAGLRPDRIAALDMFPDTFHVEAVARLVPDA